MTNIKAEQSHALTNLFSCAVTDCMISVACFHTNENMIQVMEASKNAYFHKKSILSTL